MELREAIDIENVTYFNINRQNVLDGALRALKRKTFKPMARIDVNFSDTFTGRSESGIDAGGPSREFARLLMQAVVRNSIFEGSEYAKILSRSDADLSCFPYILM